MIFHSQTYGDLPLSRVKEKITQFMRLYKDDRFKVIIGTDSQMKNGGSTDFVTAIIIHRVGHGGIYFWTSIEDTKKRVLKQRMFEEAGMSLTTAYQLVGMFQNNGISAYDFVIHVDMGKTGPTREWINQVVSMIRESGFSVKIKPDSFGASKVADRHT